MQRERLSVDRIRRFNVGEGVKQAFLWDTEVPRLAVRATAGAKSFIFETKLNRQTIRRTIGSVSVWGIEDARVEARRLQTLIDRGIDPRELDRQEADGKAAALAKQEADRQENERQSQCTLEALCNAYVELLVQAGKSKSAGNARSSFNCHVLKAFPEVAQTLANKVTARQMADMVRKVRDAGKERAAGVLRSNLSSAFNAAKRAPFDSAIPAAFIDFRVEHNPVDSIPAIPNRAGNRTLSVDELRNYMISFGDSLADQALHLALLTASQRMAQLLRAKVRDFDPDRNILRLWDGKGKRRMAREHLLPLAPQATAIVTALVERATNMERSRAEQADEVPHFGNLWLFSSTGAVKMYETTPGERLAEIRLDMKCPQFDLRDVRRTCETMLARMKISKDIRSQLLSHGVSGVQSVHYDRHDYIDEKHEALLAWEAKLNEIKNRPLTPNPLSA